MKNHILETVKSLKEEGKSEEKSINIAIERFGDRKTLNEELSKTFNVKKKISKNKKINFKHI